MRLLREVCPVIALILISGTVALPAVSQPEPRGATRGKPAMYANDAKYTMISNVVGKTGGNNVGTVTTIRTTEEVESSSSTSSSSSSSSSSATSSLNSLPEDGGNSNGKTALLLKSSTTAEISSTTKTTSSATAAAPTSKGTSTPSTISLSGSSSTTRTTSVASSPAPIETSSRTVALDATTLLSPSRKSTTTAAEFPTTIASLSAKETRESPGKIRPQIKLTTNYTSVSETGVRLPEGASAALAKPTKYHYYPHNQHIYLLPECAVQQVCNAVYVRLNFTQPLCACPGRYRDPCSASLDSDDLHTTELVTDPRTKALTLVKTCEPVAEMRECRAPRDWSLLALQNVRTGKSHYLVICRCPDANILEGPMSHDQPTYASVPGIRVYGMMCVQGNRRGRPLRYKRSPLDEGEDKPSEQLLEKEKEEDELRFPWHKVQQLRDAVFWD